MTDDGEIGDDLVPIRIQHDPSGETLDAIRRRIEADGYAIVQTPDDTSESLLCVAGLLGTVQRHIRADGAGICLTSAEAKLDSTQRWTQHRAEYQSFGTQETPAHSDGTFLEGVVADGAGLRTVGPPAYLLLQVVRNAGVGGESFLVDGKRVLLHLMEHEPEMLKVLMTPGCITYCRDDQLALNQSVFRLLGPERAVFRFRSDSKAFVPEWSRAAVERLRDHYCISDEFRRVLKMNDGETLIVDNTRVLHGRTAFVNEDRDQGRLLRRTWVEDDELIESFANLSGLAPTSRALDTYEPYGPVKNRHQSDRRVLARRGIWLDDAASERMKQIAETTNGLRPAWIHG